jgi:hypothetical protein
MLERGNPIVPSFSSGDGSELVILKYAKLKRFSAFARDAVTWIIEEENGIHKIIGQKKKPNGGWVDDPEQTFILPPGSTAEDLCDRLIAIIQEKASHP